MQEYWMTVKELINGQTTAATVIFYIVSVIALWRVFNKAGEHGWTAFIPIVNMYKMCKIADGCGWKFILYLIPIVNIFYYIAVNIRMAKAFGKSGLFGIGLIFLNIIFVYILGFGSSEYIGPRGLPRKR
ncbi:MAG: hypothetical protein E7514_05505 [Ruminococcaceae bacterium]|nr:hypothetical protein [Oscillospiraceae bacterium]